MKNLACLIIAKDEEDRIGRVLESVKWIPEIVVVVDDRTTDKTEEIARKYTPQIYRRQWDGFVGMKKFGLSKITAPWVLWLDADEVITSELEESIRELPENPGYDTFQVNIKSQFMGQWMKCWSRPQDRHVRLFRKDKVGFDESLVHEKLEIRRQKTENRRQILEDGREKTERLGSLDNVGSLKGCIEHYPVRNLSHMLDKINNYSTLAAQQMHQNGIRFHYWQLFWYPALNFFKAFLWRDGWKDGWKGLILNTLYAWNTLLDYLKLWELQRVAPAVRSSERSEEPFSPADEAGPVATRADKL